MITKIKLVWCIEDVLGRAQEKGVKLTKKEASEILQDIERHHDCELGVNWTTIDCTIDEFVANRK